jgi:hypothetical protein
MDGLPCLIAQPVCSQRNTVCRPFGYNLMHTYDCIPPSSAHRFLTVQLPPVCYSTVSCPTVTIYFILFFIYIPSIHTKLDKHKDMELVICLVLS